MVFVLNVIHDGGLELGNRFKRVAMNPRLHRTGRLAILKTGWTHITVHGHPINRQRPHPHGEFVDRISRHRFLHMNLQNDARRHQTPKGAGIDMKGSNLFNRRGNLKPVFKNGHVDFLIKPINATLRFSTIN